MYWLISFFNKKLISPTVGSLAKKVNQLDVVVHNATVVEITIFGAHLDLDPWDIFDIICNVDGNSWMYGCHVTHMLDNEITYLLVALWNYPIKIFNIDFFIHTPKLLLYSPIFFLSISSSKDCSSHNFFNSPYI